MRKQELRAREEVLAAAAPAIAARGRINERLARPRQWRRRRRRRSTACGKWKNERRAAPRRTQSETT